MIADPAEQRGIGTALRRRRLELFRDEFPDLERMHVLDLGGTVTHWRRHPLKPLSVTVVNLLAQEEGTESISAYLGDACEPPPEVVGRKYDLVYSNSLIEHVGGHARRAQLADVVHELAPHHWIQTPYRYFPIEPHWLFPGLQFLPQTARAAAIRRWPLSPAKPDADEALRDVLEVELLSKTELAYYFSDSRILGERVLGLTKSIIAVK